MKKHIHDIWNLYSKVQLQGDALLYFESHYLCQYDLRDVLNIVIEAKNIATWNYLFLPESYRKKLSLEIRESKNDFKLSSIPQHLSNNCPLISLSDNVKYIYNKKLKQLNTSSFLETESISFLNDARIVSRNSLRHLSVEFDMLSFKTVAFPIHSSIRVRNVQPDAFKDSGFPLIQSSIHTLNILLRMLNNSNFYFDKQM
ncbi:hypothetical protein AGLY_003855 [Aphis glycines]|uniref:Uncharacterized protein n=1 Tax=Aphis glycines TaxID=307491 RepID=A0A6G0U1W2_APHGL|nr:hypothetical protein AGLY_003855 [Aphis glycines]